MCAQDNTVLETISVKIDIEYIFYRGRLLKKSNKTDLDGVPKYYEQSYLEIC